MARTPEQEETLAVAKGLRSSVEGLTGEVASLAAAVRRSRILIRLLAAGGVLLAVALGVAVWALVQAGHADSRSAAASAKAAAVHAGQIAGCRVGNSRNAAEVALWVHLYKLSVTPKTPPKLRAEDDKLIAYIKAKFAQRDCQHAYRLP